MATHVSIHDVAPCFDREVRDALALCHAVGTRPALLVVPDFHGEAPLARHREFCGWLRALQNEGHEILLHGYLHRASVQSHNGAGAWRRFYTQRLVSAGEAEFGLLEREVASALLERGERVLNDVGLRTSGFVPPAWSMRGYLPELLGARGHAFTEDHLHVYRPTTGERRATLLLNYASRTPARIATTALYCRAAQPVERFLPARIAIHPGDLRVPLLRHELGRLLSRARGPWIERVEEFFS